MPDMADFANDVDDDEQYEPCLSPCRTCGKPIYVAPDFHTKKWCLLNEDGTQHPCKPRPSSLYHRGSAKHCFSTREAAERAAKGGSDA